jgi:hypothetical protein
MDISTIFHKSNQQNLVLSPKLGVVQWVSPSSLTYGFWKEIPGIEVPVANGKDEAFLCW